MKASKTLFVLLALLWSSNAMANSNDDPSNFLSFGLGAAFSSSPYQGVDSEISPFPLVIYQGERLFLQGPQFGYRLFKQDNFNLALLGSYRLQGYESDDSSFLQGMDDRNGTLEAGLQAELETDLGQFRLSVLSDLQDEHNGQEVKLEMEKMFSFQKLSISPSAALIWQSGKLADYYYGVTTAEATLARPEYEVDDTLMLEVGLMANYMLSRHWSINGRVAVSKLANEVSDSPIVNDDLVTNGFIGFSYRF